MAEQDKKIIFPLSDKERLLLQQLQLRAYLETQSPGKSELNYVINEADRHPHSEPELPEKWQLTKGINLYEWQKDALERWFKEGKKGTFKIVTGGGKTLLALAAAERLQNEEIKDLKVAIVVPTIVLMEQWYQEILEKGNIPAKFIGRLGGGYQDTFENDKVILICVLASASKKLPEIVNRSRIGSQLFLVVDECHRAGAPEMSRLFDIERAFVMGLSATPEREEDSDEEVYWVDFENSLLGKNLGRVLLELTYEDALKYGLIPPFTIKHYGLPLSPNEQYEYDQLTRALKDIKSDLQNYIPRDKYGGALFYRWAQKISQLDKGEASRLAKKYVADVARRKMLLYRMISRKEAVIKLIKQELQRNKKARILLFHESIQEANYLFNLLIQEGIPALVEHSELSDSLRLKNIELFRQGICSVLVSVKSLIEGFNVPAVDVGIIVASSTAIRQRIQSMGRVMRPYKDESGKEKTSLIHILYARNTVDEEIYAKYNWEKLTGLNRNFYFHWDPDKQPLETGKPPKLPPPSDLEIDENILKPGHEYPGEYEGTEFTCDSSRNIKDLNGNYLTGMEDLARKVIEIKGSPGRFKITPKKHFVIVQKKIDEDWIPFFVTKLDRLPTLPDTSSAPVHFPVINEINAWLLNAKPGDIYPFTQVPLVKCNLSFSQKRAGIIIKKTKGGDVFVRLSDRAINRDKGLEAEELIKRIKELRFKGEIITKLELNELNHIIYVKNGIYHFIMALSHGLEFPD